MIDVVHLENFKCFSDIEIPLRPLTLLTGINGTGKSTVVQSLALLRQSVSGRRGSISGLVLNGGLAALGTAVDVLHEFAEEDEVRIGFCEDGRWRRWAFSASESDEDVLPSADDEITPAEGLLFEEGLLHLAAERIGPRTLFRGGLQPDRRRLLAQLLSKAPYVDRLIADTEATRQQEGTDAREVDGTCAGQPCLGLVYVALTDGMSVSMSGEAMFEVPQLPVGLEILSGDASAVQTVTVSARNASSRAHVEVHREPLQRHLQREVTSGAVLLARAGDLFPRLRIGPDAQAQIRALTGNEVWFAQLLVHFQAFNQGAEAWQEGTPFAPVGAVEWSPESQTTLSHGTYGPMRDFTLPSGEKQQFSLHSKIRTGNQRVYFAEKAEPSRGGGAAQMTVLIGYVGPHLPTIKYN